MSRTKSKSAILNQTVYPHEFNTGVTARITDMVIINKDLSFIESTRFERILLSYLRKLGVEADVAMKAIKHGEQLDIVWRKRNVLVRVTNEGDSSNHVYRVYAEFYVPGYLRNGYEGEKLAYELFTSHVPSCIIAANISDRYSIIYASLSEEFEARIAAGDPILKNNTAKSV